MSRRVDEAAADSLELLLDTITNAFGSVLFVTVLIALLFRISHPKEEKPTTEESKQRMLNLQEDLAIISARIEELELTRSLAEESLSRLGDTEADKLYVEFVEKRKAKDTILNEALGIRGEIATEQIAIDELERRNNQLDHQLNQLNQDLTESRREAANERKRRTHAIIPPRTHSTTKVECSTVLRYGRLYTHHKPPDGWRLNLNFDDFVVVEESLDSLVLTPNPGKGLELTIDGESTDDVRRKLQGFPSSRFYICVCVWNDSFLQFRELKSALLKLGYEYRLIILGPDGEVISSSGVTPHVQ